MLKIKNKYQILSSNKIYICFPLKKINQFNFIHFGNENKELFEKKSKQKKYSKIYKS